MRSIYGIIFFLTVHFNALAYIHLNRQCIDAILGFDIPYTTTNIVICHICQIMRFFI